LIDCSVELAFKKMGIDFIKYPFDISGSDERQYSSPYFRIPCGTISKDKYYEYKEYHNSLDNLDFVKAKFLYQSFLLYLTTIQNIELSNLTFKSLNPAGEPFLTKRNLYSTIGITINNKNKVSHSTSQYNTVNNEKISGQEIDLILWLMFWSDGKKNLLDIAILSGQPIYDLYRVSGLLLNMNLIKQI
jgi:aminopeptidase-like protein